MGKLDFEGVKDGKMKMFLQKKIKLNELFRIKKRATLYHMGKALSALGAKIVYSLHLRRIG